MAWTHLAYGVVLGAALGALWAARRPSVPRLSAPRASVSEPPPLSDPVEARVQTLRILDAVASAQAAGAPLDDLLVVEVAERVDAPLGRVFEVIDAVRARAPHDDHHP